MIIANLVEDMKNQNDYQNLKLVAKILNKLNVSKFIELPNTSRQLANEILALDLPQNTAQFSEILLQKNQSIEQQYSEFFVDLIEQKRENLEELHNHTPDINEKVVAFYHSQLESEQKQAGPVDFFAKAAYDNPVETLNALSKELQPRLKQARQLVRQAKKLADNATELKTHYTQKSQHELSATESKCVRAATAFGLMITCALVAKFISEGGQLVIDGVQLGFNAVKTPLSATFGDELGTVLAIAALGAGLYMLTERATPPATQAYRHSRALAGVFTQARNHEEKEEDDDATPEINNQH